jgi:DNA-binding transcriptional ArsR family regulator
VANQFPHDIYRQLDGIDFRLLDELTFLCRKQRQRTGAAYCCPGREYLAGKVGCDVGTISRHTSKLERLGLLEKLQRRPVRGQWRSCLYRLRSWVSWRLGQVAGRLRKMGPARNRADRVRPHARLASVGTELVAPNPRPARKMPPATVGILQTNPILRRWLQRE